MLRRHILRLSIACGLACWLIASCKPKEENSEVKGFVTCTAVDALGAFIDSIPVPGMSLLSKIPAMAASAVAGKLKSMGKGKLGAVSGCAGGASLTEVSDNSLGQIKEIVRDAYAEQNHLDAKASLVSLQTAWDRFVPDTETAHDYTMNNLNDMAKIADDWWARYDRSGQRIYNVNDFILVTGVQLKVLQEQVHTVALGAAKTGGQDEIGRVRSYAENLARTADHVRKELFEIAEKDIYGMARAMYSLNQVQDGPLVYDGAAFYPHQNICYFSKNRQSIDLSKPKAAHETHSINELSAWLGMYGAICCSFGRDGTCKNQESKIEPLLEKRIDALAQQIQRVMFSENAAIQNYVHNTLPMLIQVANQIKNAEDNAVVALASGNGAAPSNSSSTESFCPDGSNGAGQGYGIKYTCGDKQCAKSDKDGINQCVIASGGSNTAAFCPDGSNGAGQGYGIKYTCGDKQCAKSDKDGKNQCVIASGGSNSPAFCPDGSNGSGQGYGIKYTCGDKQCAKSDKDGKYPCVIR